MPAGPASPAGGAPGLPCVLAVGGSDSSGGAGLQMDVRVIWRLGAHPACAVTAVTVQDSLGVSAVRPVPARLVEAQMAAVAADLPVAAVKTGMLANAAVARVVARCLRRLRLGPVVVDPVLAAGTGEGLWSGRDLAPWRDLLALAEVATPNVPEAAALLGWEPDRLRGVSDLREAAAALLRLGPRWACVTGGHLPDGPEVADVLTDGRGLWVELRPRLPLWAPHGAGCAFSAALAAGLARGLEVPAAFRAAGAYVRAALARAVRLGRGRPFVVPDPDRGGEAAE